LPTSTIAVAVSASAPGRGPHELDREHGAEAAHVADLREPLLPALHPRAHRVAENGRPGAEILLLDHVEHCVSSRLRDRVPDVGAADRRVARRVHDLRLPDHAGTAGP
jgi:hypothetical protein